MGHSDANGRQRRSKSVIRVVVSGKVYNVTDFVDRHPGGRDVLLQHDGQDVQAAMQDSKTHVHSQAAYSVLEKYLVGDVDSVGLEDGTYKEHEPSTQVSEEYYKNDIVDWSKPLLDQVELLGDKYFDWTHQQVDRPIRLFQSDMAEILTKAHWWFVPVTWVPIVIYFAYTSFGILSHKPEVWPANGLGCQLGPTDIPFLLVFGVLIWTLLEYVIHRWLFHLRPPANWPFLIRLHFALHGQHHKSPMDPLRLVFPPLPAAVFAILLLGCFLALFPKGAAFSLVAGIVTGYVVYDLTHYYIHHGHPSIPYFQRLKSYHIHHHYKHQQLGFGISSKLWDYPFGTLLPDDQRKLKSAKILHEQ